jgi:hypothetical protein
MFEVRGKHFLGETGDIFNDEWITCSGPANNILNFFILD